MLEAHRHLVTRLSIGRRHPIQQVGGGDIAHSRAAPALVFQQIVIQEHQDLIDRNIICSWCFELAGVSLIRMGREMEGMLGVENSFKIFFK